MAVTPSAGVREFYPPGRKLNRQIQEKYPAQEH
jgi:hypothetical protein